MSAQFTLYAVDCQPFGRLAAQHTYVQTSDNRNFNCFGRWTGGQAVRSPTIGSSKWAGLIYGAYEGSQDQTKPAAGIRVRYDGVCQNAANRLLVLTGDSANARGTKGNVLATLLYGVFGHNLDEYINSVKATGAQLLQGGEIQAPDIAAVLKRIAIGQTPDAELDILHVDMQEQESAPLPAITDAQRSAFRPIYGDYQRDRLTAFQTVASTVPFGTEIANDSNPVYPLALIQPLRKCVTRLIEAVGADGFDSMLGVTPDQLTAKLAGFK